MLPDVDVTILNQKHINEKKTKKDTDYLYACVGSYKYW